MKNVVLQITPFFRPDMGGVQTHLDDLCEYLRNNGWYTYVYTYQPLKLKKSVSKLEKKENLEIHRISWIRGNWANVFENYPLLRFLYLTVMLLTYCFWFMFSNHKKIKIIHAHGMNAGFVAVVLKIFFNRKIILSTHGVYGENISSSKKFVKKFINPILLNRFDKILTTSNKSTEELVEQGLERKKIQRYTHWVNQDIFKPYNKEKIREDLDLNYKKIVLFIGRLIPAKGVKLLVEVARQLKEIDFAFIGDGPLSSWMKKQEGKMSNIHYLGKVDNCDLPKYYSAADLLCVPSLCEEGFPRVIVEAISCGVPVIGSNGAGICEAIDKKVGILFEPRLKSIRYAILNILDNQDKYRKSCLEYAKEKYSNANAGTIVNAYLRN